MVNNGVEGVLVLDISNPQVPYIVEKIDTRGYAMSSVIQGNYLYVADGPEGFSIIDVSDYAETIYEDAEDGTTSGWTVYDQNPAGAQITDVFDIDRQSNVIELLGTGKENGYQLRNDDLSKWHNSKQFVIEWSMKYSESFSVFIDVETTAGPRYLNYTLGLTNNLGVDRYVHHGLGANLADAQWHTFVRDLQSDLAEAQPGVNILEVNGFLIRGSGYVDDIKLF